MRKIAAASILIAAVFIIALVYFAGLNWIDGTQIVRNTTQQQATTSYLPVSSCPNIPAYPSKADILQLINSTNSTKNDCCSLAALKLYNSSGYLSKYNISLPERIYNATCSGIYSSPAIIVRIIKPGRSYHGMVTEKSAVSGTSEFTSNYYAQALAYNWAGYVVSYNFPNSLPYVTNITGEWIVQNAFQTSNNSFSSQWIGIGGYADSTLIQTGTESDYNVSTGSAQYYPWYELLPAAETQINDVVKPGDIMRASIGYFAKTGTWNITLQDITQGWVYTNNGISYNSSKASGEWIDERTQINGQLPNLANFTFTRFFNSTATINGISGPISSFPYENITAIDEHSPYQVLAYVPGLSSNGKNFSVIYANNFTSPSLITPYITELDYGQIVDANIITGGGAKPYVYTAGIANTTGSTYATYSLINGSSSNDVNTIPIPINVIPGVYQFYYRLHDSANVPYYFPTPYTSAYITNSFNVASEPSITLSPSNTLIDAGQEETYSISVSGGIGPFNVELYNITSGKQFGTNVVISSPGGTNTITFLTSNTGTFSFNAIATDEGTSIPYTFGSVPNSIIVNTDPSLHIFPSNTILDAGQEETYFISVSGGTGPFNVELYNITSGKQAGANAIIDSPGGTNTITFLTSNTGTFSFNAIGIDEGSQSYKFTSSPNSIRVNTDLQTPQIFPGNGVYYPGQEINMSVSVSGGTTPYSYQWYNYTSGSPIPIEGANSATLTEVPGPTSQKLMYYAEVTDSASTSQSANSPVASFYIKEVYLPSANIVYYIPITITNNQDAQFPANITLPVVYNAINYQQYETPELNNSEFFFENGTIINSWLQGSILNGTNVYRAGQNEINYLNSTLNLSANTVTSANALSGSKNVEWWIKIPTNSFLPPDSSNTIFLGWAGNAITSSNIMMNGIYTGEASYLSKSYGAFDNGANVFLYYSPSYNISGYGSGGDAVNSIYMKDMLTPYGVTANVVNLNFGQFYGTVFFDMAWLSKLKIGDNVILEGWGPSFSFRGNNNTTSYGYSLGSGAYISIAAPNKADPPNLNGTSFINGSYNQYSNQPWGWVYDYISGNSLYTGLYPSPPDPYNSPRNFLERSYNSINSTFGANDEYIGLGGAGYGNSNMTYYEARARLYPPNGVMPAESFGNVASVPYPYTVLTNPSNSLVDAGEEESFTATVRGGEPPYSYRFESFSADNPNVIINSQYESNVLYGNLTWTFPINSIYASNSPVGANVIVYSSNGAEVGSAYSPTQFTANNALGIPSLNLSFESGSNALDLGQPMTLESMETGGTKPYVYRFAVYSLSSGNIIFSENTSSNTIKWAPVNASPGESLYAVVYITDSASSKETANSLPSNSFYLYNALNLQNIFPINSSNYTKAYALCADAPGYAAYPDPGLFAAARYFIDNHYIMCFKQDITVHNSTGEGADSFFTHYRGARFMGILDYATVDSYLAEKYGCAYTSCNYSSANFSKWTLSDWNASVRDALDIYPYIHEWEIWNEPNNYQSGYQNNTPLNYFNMIKSAGTIIHSKYPNDTVVCFGGEDPNGVQPYSSGFEWWQTVWDYGASKYCNAVSVHYEYTDLKATLNALWNLTHVPIWDTEIGVDDSNQTQYIDYLYGDLNLSFGSSPHFKKLFWFTSISTGFGYWGLINSYPISYTPMLSAFVNYSRTHYVYSQLKLNVNPGQTIPFSINVTGGRKPYLYDFIIYNNKTMQILSNVTSANSIFNYTIPANAEGQELFGEVIVKDANNETINSSESDILNVSSSLGCEALCAPNISIPSNQIVAGTYEEISATPDPYTDKVSIMINGNAVATGTGTISFNTNSLNPGNYSVYAHDLSNGENSLAYNLAVNDTFTMPPLFPALQTAVTGPNTTSGDSVYIMSFNGSGGSAPYTFEWLVKAPGSQSYINDTACNPASKAMVQQGHTTVFVCNLKTNSSTATGTYSFELKASDNSSNTVYGIPANVIVLKGGPARITISPGSGNIIEGNTISFSNSTEGGIAPYSNYHYTNYSYLVYQDGNAIQGSQNTTIKGNQVMFNSPGIYNVSEVVHDSDGQVAYSPNATIYVASLQPTTTIPASTTIPATTTIQPTTTVPPSSGGGGGGGGGGSGSAPAGGGGSSKPITTSIPHGFLITNIAKLNYFVVNFCGQPFDIRDNFISPNQSGVSINNVPYTMLVNQSLLIGEPNCYLELYNVSYLPIEHTVAIKVYHNLTRLSIYINGTKFSANPSTYSGYVNISAAHYSVPNAYKLIREFNITASYNITDMLNLSIYFCNNTGKPVYPFIENAGTWSEIQNYTYITGECIFRFSIPNDPVIALLSNNQSKNITTTTTTIPSKTTSITTTVAQPSHPVSQSNSSIATPATSTQSTAGYRAYAASTLIAIAIVVSIAYLLRRRKRKGLPPLIIKQSSNTTAAGKEGSRGKSGSAPD